MNAQIYSALENIAPTLIGIAMLVFLANLGIWKIKMMRRAAIEAEEMRQSEALERKSHEWKSMPLNSPLNADIVESEFGKQFAASDKALSPVGDRAFVGKGKSHAAPVMNADVRRDAMGLVMADYAQEIIEESDSPEEVALTAFDASSKWVNPNPATSYTPIYDNPDDEASVWEKEHRKDLDCYAIEFGDNHNSDWDDIPEEDEEHNEFEALKMMAFGTPPNDPEDYAAWKEHNRRLEEIKARRGWK